MKRYDRNIGSITSDEQQSIRGGSVFIAGLGGLGGYVAEELARLGLDCLALCDGGEFDESNLNRQLYAVPQNCGQNKAEAAAMRIAIVNPDVRTLVVNKNINEKNKPVLEGYSLVIDALDNPAARILLEQAAHEAGVTLVHGAVSGWWGQVGISRPGDFLIKTLFSGMEKGDPPSVTAPAAAFVASAMAVQTALLLAGRDVLAPCSRWVADMEGWNSRIIKICT